MFVDGLLQLDYLGKTKVNTSLNEQHHISIQIATTTKLF
jgi:hypothetical protein